MIDYRGRLCRFPSPSFCLFLCLSDHSITQKQMTQVFKRGIGKDLRYPRSDMIWAERSKVKVMVRIMVRVQQYGLGSNSMSAY